MCVRLQGARTPKALEEAVRDDERASRADLRRQIAALELVLARLFGSAFPRTGINFAVAGLGGPRLLSVDELGPRLRAISERKPDARVFVRGDKVIDYGRVMQVVGAIHAAGFSKVALVTEFDEKAR